MNIFEKVKEAICKVHPGVDESEIDLDALLGDDLEIDSLGKVELALEIEDTFGCNLPDEELRNIATVGDIISLIELKLKD